VATKFDGFGASVAVSGKTIVVGAYGGPAGAGVAYVYEKGAPGWPASPTATLTDPDATSGDLFGYSVAVSGSAIVIGAPGTNSNAGSEYIYIASSSVWPSTPTVIAPNPAPSLCDGFGVSVAISGSNVVVGAAGSTEPVATLTDPGGDLADEFGRAVAVSNGAVIVGAPGTATGEGAAYMYTG
jgi:hypothetical protein